MLSARWMAFNGAAFGDDFDLKNYDDLIGLAGDKYAALFR